jgi:selenocysteine-specific elongation factor
MNVVHYIIATAGHVDHGKSALVRALTGIDPDRLPEEKARGITIELGFAHLDLPAPRQLESDTLYRVGIVDVPGHEDFVKNMVAGVGSIDLALLVISAKDGWMPQTEEHLQILTYAGVARGVVALTMADLVPSTDQVVSEVRERLRGTALAEAPIVATSAVSGAGLEQLKCALASELSRTLPQHDLGKPRLAVDRAFTIRGTGTVVTGTLTGGTLSRGQSVIIEPHGIPARIRSIQSYNIEVGQAMPGSRVALNLPDVHVKQSGHSGASVGRGDVITAPGLGRGSDTLDALLEMSARRGTARPLKEGTRVRIHHGSGNIPAQAYFLGNSALTPGQTVLSQIRFEQTVFAFVGDRFIVRDWSEQQTLAGGIVLDADASRRGFRTRQRQQFLQARADHAFDAATFVSTELGRQGAAPRSSLLNKSRFGRPQIDQATEGLLKEQKLVARGEWIVDKTWWEGLRRKALDAIDAAHQSRPQESGLRLADLRQLLGREASRAEIFESLVDDLCQNGCARAGIAIRRSNHRPALPPHLRPAGARVRASLSARPLEPPSRKELAPDALTQQALRFLLQSGEAVEVGEELVLEAEPYHQAIATIRSYIQSHGSASVSELRQVLKTSRRVMVPLLEKLDREGITLRQGDKRVLRPNG